MGNIIEFKNVSKIYRIGFLQKKTTAVKDLSFQVPENKIFGFLGANGAGKTTSIKMILGLQFPNAGEIFVAGKPVNEMEVKSRLGYASERPYFHENLNGKEFLNFHRSLFGKYLAGRKLLSNEELLEMVGLTHMGAKKISECSKGMQQRLGIAQALVNNPELVILDEPMSGLDPVGRKEVREVIVRLHEMGKTVFFSSHILSDVESICHQIAFLEKGEMKSQGSVQEIIGGAGSSKGDLVFSGLSSSQVESNAVLKNSRQIGDSWRTNIRAEELQDALEYIWQNKGSVISYGKQQMSLEEALFTDEGVR